VPVKLTLLVVLVAVATSVAAGCDNGAPNALYSFGGWGSGTSRDPVGKRIALTGIALCTRGHSPVTLTSIEPVTVTGDMHVDRLLVRRGASDQLNESAMPFGAPRGSRPAAGFTIPAPTKPCNIPGTGSPRYEAIILAHRTGPYYGAVTGLRVNYRVGDAHGAYTIDVTFCLSGKGAADASDC
jgi:hypothetical protein